MKAEKEGGGKEKKKKKSEKLNGSFVISNNYSDCLDKTPISEKEVKKKKKTITEKKDRRSSSRTGPLRLEKTKRENFEELLNKMSRSSPRLDISEDVLDYSPKGGRTGGDSPSSSSTTTSATYRPYLDGKLCENKQPFGEVHFCFTCDRENEETLTPKPAIRTAGMKSNSNGVMVPIYRQFFMCKTCHEDLSEKGILRMTSRAHETYFQ